MKITIVILRIRILSGQHTSVYDHKNTFVWAMYTAINNFPACGLSIRRLYPEYGGASCQTRPIHSTGVTRLIHILHFAELFSNNRIVTVDVSHNNAYVLGHKF